MIKQLEPDLERDAILFGDMLNLQKLKDIQNPTQDVIRLHVATVRRLLLDGELAAAAGRRKLPISFHPIDSKPLVTGVRNRRLIAFCLFGVDVFGLKVSGALFSVGALSFNEEFSPDKIVCFNLDSFLKQTIAAIPQIIRKSTADTSSDYISYILLTRRDVILYVANKIGGVHYDLRAKGQLTIEKMRALGLIRRSLDICLEDHTLVANFNMSSIEEEHSSTFKYNPNKIDAVYLEFLAIVENILASPDIKTLRSCIATDIGVEL